MVFSIDGTLRESWIRLDGSNEESWTYSKSRQTPEVLANLRRDFALGLHLCHVHGGARRAAGICRSASLAPRRTATDGK